MAQLFGPVIQLLFRGAMLLLFAWLICAAAYWGEGRLVKIGGRALWALPFPLLAAGMLYGGARFSGALTYPADGWDPSGVWNYTNQNAGWAVLLLCGCLLLGAVLAVRRRT